MSKNAAKNKKKREKQREKKAAEAATAANNGAWLNLNVSYLSAQILRLESEASALGFLKGTITLWLDSLGFLKEWGNHNFYTHIIMFCIWNFPGKFCLSYWVTY